MILTLPSELGINPIYTGGITDSAGGVKTIDTVNNRIIFR